MKYLLCARYSSSANSLAFFLVLFLGISFSPMVSVTICILIVEFIVCSELHINHLQDGIYILLEYIPLASPVKIEVFMPLKLSIWVLHAYMHLLFIYLLIYATNNT